MRQFVLRNFQPRLNLPILHQFLKMDESVKSILFQKFLKKILLKQLFAYFKNLLSKHQCGHVIADKKVKTADKKVKTKFLKLNNLLKIFVCISHEMLLVKLHANGLLISALKNGKRLYT